MSPSRHLIIPTFLLLLRVLLPLVNDHMYEADTHCKANGIFQREVFASGSDKQQRLYQDEKTFVCYFVSFLSYSFLRKCYKCCNILFEFVSKIRRISVSGFKSNFRKK